MSKKTTGFRPEIWGLVFGLLLFTVLGGCKKALPEWGPMKHAPPAPGKTWKPTPDSEPEALPSERLPGMPPELEASVQQLTLVQLIDVALRINPSTWQAWELARAAAAGWGVSRGEYYPTISGDVMGGWKTASNLSVKRLSGRLRRHRRKPELPAPGLWRSRGQGDRSPSGPHRCQLEP